jgi:hypothetical protein
MAFAYLFTESPKEHGRRGFLGIMLLVISDLP